MPRPRCWRQIEGRPVATVFKPAGLGVGKLRELTMSLDEFEALRLADLEGLYQEAAAERMGVSRATFGRILAAARRKVAEALVEGHALRIDGGEVPPRANEPAGRGPGRGGGHGKGRGHRGGHGHGGGRGRGRGSG